MVKLVALSTVGFVLWFSQTAVSHSSPVVPPMHQQYRVYLPRWLPSGFHQASDPLKMRYPDTSGNFFQRRYAAHRRWVDIFEGPAGCCLDSQPRHRAGRVLLSAKRSAFFSNQGKQFGGLYLFWDQRRTYIAINSPNLSKSVLVDIAQSFTETSYVRP